MTRRTLFALLGLCLMPGLMEAWVFWHGWPDSLFAPNRQLVVRDYLNLWAGGTLAGHGRLDTVFDPVALARWLWATFGPGLDLHSWGYPPHLLLVAIPLSHLPLVAGYVVWITLTTALLWWVLRLCRLPAPWACAALASPAVLANALLGQNGALTASALTGGLLLSGRRPMLAGALLGLLTVKPQLGLLVPVCLVARREWRTLGWAAVFGGGYCLAGVIAFGWDVWRDYATVTAPFMRGYIEAPFGLAAHYMMVPPFITLRALGAGLTAAYAGQAAASLGCAVLAAWAWSRNDRATATALVLCLAPLATPYAHSYDLVCVAVACVLLHRDRNDLAALAPAWIWPGIAFALGTTIAPGLAVFCIAPAVVLALRRLLPARPLTGWPVATPIALSDKGVVP
jgi:Glycosyltransferase family 87